jgi:enoyl-CoA hydratase/carnithine racemase
MTATETETAQDVLVDRADTVSTISINRPRRRNALTYQTMIRLAECIETEAQRSDTRAIVLTGEGGSFCAGADLAFAAAADGAAVTPEDGIRAANRIVTAILSAPVPIVARVPGPAVGVGVPIALAADIVVASQEAYFLLAFTKVGLMPDGGASLLLSASIGRARALSMALRAEPMPAAVAASTGLIDTVLPSGWLDHAVRDIVDHFVRGPRQDYASTKHAINAATLQALGEAMEREVDGQARLLQSPDFMEGAMAMLQKRSPQFSD